MKLFPERGESGCLWLSTDVAVSHRSGSAYRFWVENVGRQVLAIGPDFRESDIVGGRLESKQQA